MTADPTSPAQVPCQRLWVLTSWLLNQSASQANRMVGESLGRPGLRRRYAVLAGLDEFGPISQAALSRRLGLDRSDLVAALNELEGLGFALRAADQADQRRNTIRITPEGSDELERLDPLVLSAQDTLLAPLSAEQRGQLNQLLQLVLRRHLAFDVDVRPGVGVQVAR